MRNTTQNGANIKSTPKMAVRARKTINKEGNNVPWRWKENSQNTNDRLNKMSKEMTQLTKSLVFTQDQLEG